MGRGEQVIVDHHARAAGTFLGRLKQQTHLTGELVFALRDQLRGTEQNRDVTVVTAGAWVRKLVPSVDVRPTRETLAYFRRNSTPMASLGQLDPETRGHAQFSLHDPKYGLKVGAHHAGPEADPNVPGEPEPDLIERITAWARETYRLADPDPVGAETCMYTTAPGEQFILERRGRVVIGSACSGHGFKFAPAVGRRLADLATAIL